jgi:hypothetical protein
VIDEHVGQVVGEIAAVGGALKRVDAAEGAADLALGADGYLKRAQNPRCPSAEVFPLGRWRDAEQRTPQQGAHPRTERLVLGDLRLDRNQVTLFLGDVAKRAQQHGLADAAQADHDHRLVAVALLHTAQQHPKRVELRLAAGEIPWFCAGVRGVRVVLGQHAFSSLPRFTAIG